MKLCIAMSLIFNDLGTIGLFEIWNLCNIA